MWHRIRMGLRKRIYPPPPPRLPNPHTHHHEQHTHAHVLPILHTSMRRCMVDRAVLPKARNHTQESLWSLMLKMVVRYKGLTFSSVGKQHYNIPRPRHGQSLYQKHENTPDLDRLSLTSNAGGGQRWGQGRAEVARWRNGLCNCARSKGQGSYFTLDEDYAAIVACLDTAWHTHFQYMANRTDNINWPCGHAPNKTSWFVAGFIKLTLVSFWLIFSAWLEKVP